MSSYSLIDLLLGGYSHATTMPETVPTNKDFVSQGQILIFRGKTCNIASEFIQMVWLTRLGLVEIKDSVCQLVSFPGVSLRELPTYIFSVTHVAGKSITHVIRSGVKSSVTTQKVLAGYCFRRELDCGETFH